jgi:hypothetical protein
MGNCIAGSNPALSANEKAQYYWAFLFAAGLSIRQGREGKKRTRHTQTQIDESFQNTFNFISCSIFKNWKFTRLPKPFIKK